MIMVTGHRLIDFKVKPWCEDAQPPITHGAILGVFPLS